MLVLSRKVEQQITIGDDIWITIVRIGDNIVRVGVEAPSHIKVLRTELVEPARPLVAEAATDA